MYNTFFTLKLKKNVFFLNIYGDSLENHFSIILQYKYLRKVFSFLILHDCFYMNLYYVTHFHDFNRCFKINLIVKIYPFVKITKLAKKQMQMTAIVLLKLLISVELTLDLWFSILLHVLEPRTCLYVSYHNN